MQEIQKQTDLVTDEAMDDLLDEIDEIREDDQKAREEDKVNMKIFIPFVVVMIALIAAIAFIVVPYVAKQRQSRGFTTNPEQRSYTCIYVPADELDTGGNIIGRQVFLKNGSEKNALGRVKLEFDVPAMAGVTGFSYDGQMYYPAAGSNGFRENLPANWTYISKDEDPVLGGYYYYTVPLTEDQQSESLFNSLSVSFEETEDIQDFQINITTETIEDKIDITSFEDVMTQWRKTLT